MNALLGGADDLVDRIYEASVLPEFWPAVIASMAASVAGDDALLSSVRADGVRMIATSARLTDAWNAVFGQFPGASNPRTQRLLAARHPGFLTDHDVFSDDEMSLHPLYRDVLVPRGYGCGVATAVHFPNGDAIVVNVERAASAGRFPRSSVDRLDALRPHLARSALISARLAFERARTAVETLAGIDLAACAATRSGTVLVANEGFSAEMDHWTTRGGGRIALVDRRADALLRNILAGAEGASAVRSLPLVANERAAPAVLHVVPVRRAAHDLFGHATAILVLTKASETPTQATPLLQALFDLTPAEADVAARIAAGRTAEQIALADAKSAGTVRNQLKSVLAKTGCRRQVDLARLLAQLLSA